MKNQLFKHIIGSNTRAYVNLMNISAIMPLDDICQVHMNNGDVHDCMLSAEYLVEEIEGGKTPDIMQEVREQGSVELCRQLAETKNALEATRNALRTTFDFLRGDFNTKKLIFTRTQSDGKEITLKALVNYIDSQLGYGQEPTPVSNNQLIQDAEFYTSDKYEYDIIENSADIDCDYRLDIFIRNGHGLLYNAGSYIYPTKERAIREVQEFELTTGKIMSQIV